MSIRSSHITESQTKALCRRVAAMSVAKRVSEEGGWRLGEEVSCGGWVAG